MTAVFTSAASPALEAARRGRIYKLLALGFSYPDADFHDAVLSGHYRTALLDELREVNHLAPVAAAHEKLLSRSEKPLRKIDGEGFEVLYTSTFDVGAPKPPCPPYEGLYRDGEDRCGIMVEISGFYRFFGLALDSSDEYLELPDHLCAELEFMHVLATKEAEAREQANDRECQSLLRAQRDFLERHLVMWLPLFADKLKKKDALPFYVQLARVGVAVVERDLKLLREQVPQPAPEIEEESELQPAHA